MSFDFDFENLAPAQKTVRYKGQEYSLREASAGAAREYRNAGLRAAKMADGKVVGMDGAADVEMLLVSLCLFDKDDKPVSMVRLEREQWPNRVVRPLYDWVKDVSQLDEVETVETVKKQIEKLQSRLAKLEDDQGKKS